jgi:hypothetical protein
MTMRMPGQPTPMAIATYTTEAAQTKRLGLIPMVPDSAHMIVIGTGREAKRVQVTCRDRRGFPDATGLHLCLGPGCSGKWWTSEAEMKSAHPTALELVARQEVHVHGFWSNDDCALPADNCPACEKATKDATSAATREARVKSKDAAEVVVLRACDEHSGGAVGLLTPADPNG